MKLRRRIVLTAAAILLSVMLIVAVGAIWLLKTDSGFSFVRGQLYSALTKKIKGKIYMGRLTGSAINAPTLDSIEIRDLDDSVLFASGPISFKLDPLDLWAKRLAFHNVVIERPYFHLRRLPTGEWNYKPMFARDTSRTIVPRVPGTGRKMGDFIVLDSVQIHAGQFHWTEPWSPAKWFAGTDRDSVIKFNLARKDVEVRRIGRKYFKLRHWTNLELVAPMVRIKDPDHPGFAVDFARLDVNENDPPFNLKNANGTFSLLRDTARVEVKAFQLPGSAGRASGVLYTKPGLGVRVRVTGDTVSMNDIAWLYPTMPKEGGGKMVLDILKDSTDDHIDFALSKIDVQSVKSRIKGNMTFGTGEQILALKNVDVDLAPVNFKLIEQFSGGPLSLPWAGDLNGHVTAKGGPLTRFYVDSTAIAFSDANVPGVVNRFSGHGLLDINRPLYTTFYDFSAQIYHFDLRTAQKLDTLFPPLKGSFYGSAQLDSLWTDLRLRDANVFYVADSAHVSHFTGGGRVIVGEKEMAYDLAMNADPVLLESFALSYPDFPLKGTFRGPFTVKGTIGALELTGDLTGEGGRVRTSGFTVDELEPVFGATGTLEFSTIDLARVLIRPPTWNGTLSGVVDMAMNYEYAADSSITNPEGRARVRLSKSKLADLGFRDGYASFTFGDGLVRVDSLNLNGDVFAMQGKGALGMRRDRRDSLFITAQLDSLGGLRPFIAPVIDTMPVDSLKGTLNGSAKLFGNLDSLDFRALLTGNNIVYGTTTANTVEAGFDIADLLGRRVGTATLNAKAMYAGGIQFSDMKADARLLGGDTTRVTAKLTSTTGPVIDGGASITWDSTSARTLLDSLQIALADHRWRLTRASLITSTPSMFSIDTLELRSASNARISLAARVPVSGELSGMFRADSFPLTDLGKLFQVTVPLSGVTEINASLSGTQAAPLMKFDLRALDAGLGETRVEGLHVFGDYSNRLVKANLEYSSKNNVIMHGDAKLPIDLAFQPVAKRFLDTPLEAKLDADSTDLGLLKTFWSGIQAASGRFDAHLTVGGTWSKLQYGGAVKVSNGTLTLAKTAVPYRNLRSSIRFTGDSIVIDSLAAYTGTPSDDLRIFGNVNLKDRTNPAFSLRVRANNFHAINNRAIANLSITTDRNLGIRLEGSQASSTLTGGVIVNGQVYIPDTYYKTLITFSQDYLSTIDTSVFANKRLLPPTPPKVVENMAVQDFQITAGDNLTLKSAEANVRLSGGLKLDRRNTDRGPQLELLGGLRSEGGTYRLNLGIVQRPFVVEPGGTIEFFGDPERDAEIKLRALYTIRQYDQRDARQDITVRVEIGGTMTAPTLRLSSPDTRLSDQDLFNYLAFGTPSFEIGRGTDYANVLTSGLLTSGASALSAGVAGGACNFSTANVTGGYNNGIGQATRNILTGTRIGCGKQFTEKTFARLDVGFCQFDQQIADFANSVGAKLEYRFTSNMFVSGGFDPPTSALVCANANNARGFVPTPRQVGIDFFRSWRW